jgi:hypothetical protein
VRSSFLSQPLITFILSTASRMLWLWRMQCKTSTSGSWFQDSAERIISARRWSPQPWRRWQGDSASRDQWCFLRNWSKGQFAGNHGLYPHLYVYIYIQIYIYTVCIYVYIYTSIDQFNLFWSSLNSYILAELWGRVIPNEWNSPINPVGGHDIIPGSTFRKWWYQ